MVSSGSELLITSEPLTTPIGFFECVISGTILVAVIPALPSALFVSNGGAVCSRPRVIGYTKFEMMLGLGIGGIHHTAGAPVVHQ